MDTGTPLKYQGPKPPYNAPRYPHCTVAAGQGRDARFLWVDFGGDSPHPVRRTLLTHPDGTPITCCYDPRPALEDPRLRHVRLLGGHQPGHPMTTFWLAMAIVGWRLFHEGHLSRVYGPGCARMVTDNPCACGFCRERMAQIRAARSTPL